MKILELINILNEYNEKYGDVEIYISMIFNGCNIIRNPHIKYIKEYNSVMIK